MALMAAGSLLLTQVSVDGSYFGDIFFGLLCAVSASASPSLPPRSRRSRASPTRVRARLGPRNTALQIGTALGVAIVTTVAVSRSADYLAATKARTRSSC